LPVLAGEGGERAPLMDRQAGMVAAQTTKLPKARKLHVQKDALLGRRVADVGRRSGVVFVAFILMSIRLVLLITSKKLSI
jgi:hypothetical protein